MRKINTFLLSLMIVSVATVTVNAEETKTPIRGFRDCESYNEI